MTVESLTGRHPAKYPWISEANPSYHGVSFSDAAGSAAFVTYIRAVILRDTGATLSPFHSFIFLQGLETLSLRVERHVSNALKIVEYLANHPQVEAVHHPSLETESTHELYKRYLPNGGGSIFTFEIKGDAQTAQAFIDQLSIFSLLGKCSRREISGDSSGNHHSQPVYGGRIVRSGNQTKHDPAFNRN